MSLDLRPLSGTFRPPDDNMCEYEAEEKPKDTDENLSQCHFANHKSHYTDLGANTDRCSEKLATNHLSYCSASKDIALNPF
jgi:hypothetical protein